jgi:hypothetical protein
MHLLIALLIGAVLAAGAATALVHDNTVISPASTRVLYNYGSG